MVDSLLWHRSGTVIINPNTGAPATAGVVRFFDDGTSNPRTVYTASDLTGGVTTLTLDGNGVASDIWVGTGAWKYTIEDSGGTVFATHDGQLGATDTSGFLTGTVKPAREIITKSGAYTTVEADHGKQINANASGGDFTITLDSAVDYADAGDQLIKNIGDTGVVTVAAPGVETIDGQASILVGPRNSVVIRSDGSGFYVSEAYNATAGSVAITYAASITPDLVHPTDTEYVVNTVTGNMAVNNPDNVRPGTQGIFRFVMDGTGNHTITWGGNYSGSPHLSTEANGVSIIGWVATSTTNIELFTLKGPRAETLSAIIVYSPSSGTAGQTATTGSFAKVTLNGSASYTDSRALKTLSSSVMTLHPGTHRIKAWFPVNNTAVAMGQIYNTTDASLVGVMGVQARSSAGNANPSVYVDTGLFTITAEKDVELQCRAANGGTLGSPASFGINESYVRVEIYTQ